jgi:hypothetical protein
MAPDMLGPADIPADRYPIHEAQTHLQKWCASFSVPEAETWLASD